LPCNIDWAFEFPSTPNANTVDVAAKRALAIGSDADVPIYVDSASGQLFEVADDKSHPKFLNSTIARFGKFLQLFHQYRSAVSELDPDDQKDDVAAMDIVAELKQQMQSIDPDALANPTHCWREVLEQMEDGQL
jgi:hypothetical protein